MNKLIKAALIIGLVAASPYCIADGNELLRKCNATIQAADTSTKLAGKSHIDIGWCLGYFDGVRSSAHIYQTIFKENQVYCIPESVENGQIIRVVIKYLNENPKDLHQHESLLTMAAIREAFPCQEEE